MPAARARCSTASTKLRCSIFWMKEMTSPPSPQPKQYQRLRAGVTLNEGVFSSWKGHRPLREPPPALRSWRYSPTTSAIGERSRTSATSSSLIRPATEARVFVAAGLGGDGGGSPAVGAGHAGLPPTVAASGKVAMTDFWGGA